MKKKLNLLSLMLLGLLSFFTSCVDGDYYDLYEDEEMLLPRNKKGKECAPPEEEVDLNIYPKMNQGDSEYNGWYHGECVACCYQQFNPNANKVQCRLKVIKAMYGSLANGYEAYFDGVENVENLPNQSQIDEVFSEFQCERCYVEVIGKAIIDSYDKGMNITYDKVAVFNKNLRHLAKVENITVSKSLGIYTLKIDVIDQYGSRPDHYRVSMLKKGTVLHTDIDCFYMP